MGKIVNISELKVGMVLDKDIVDKDSGAILIPRGKTLTRNFIDKLYNNKLYLVYIEDDNFSGDFINYNFAKAYSNVEKRLDDIYELVEKGESIEEVELTDEMEQFVDEIVEISNISAQMKLLKERDDYTFNHGLGVSILAISLGKWLGYGKECILELSIAGLLHDIGKLKVPQEIVNKPGKLTFDEWEIMKKHSMYSYEILLETGNFSKDVLLGVLQHHERVNGSGYHYGLKGNDIHEYAKIIGVCDIYHALTSDRVYKRKDSPFNVANYLRAESFESLDPNIVNVFLESMSRFYVGNKVLISDGSIGTIVYIHPQDKTKSVVQINDKFIDFLEEDKLEILDIII